MAISGSIFVRGVALSEFSADVLKLRQKFGPYKIDKASQKSVPPPFNPFYEESLLSPRSVSTS